MILCLQIKSLVNNKRDDGEKGRDCSKLCNVNYRRSHTYLDFGRAKVILIHQIKVPTTGHQSLNTNIFLCDVILK